MDSEFSKVDVADLSKPLDFHNKRHSKIANNLLDHLLTASDSLYQHLPFKINSTNHCTAFRSTIETMAIANGTSHPTTVVLGSMSRAREYQTLLIDLKNQGGEVRGEMVDRILDNGKSSPPFHRFVGLSVHAYKSS